MNNRSLIKGKFWIILGIVLLISGMLTLCSFFLISSTAQTVFYILYVVLTIIAAVVLHKNYSLRVHHIFFILFNLLLIYVTYLNHFIAFPLLLLFPLFCSQKPHFVFKIFSVISYALLIIVMSLAMFIRLIFTATNTARVIDSPDDKYIISVYSIDEGALGGATQIKLAEKYFNIFKHERLIYSGDFGEAEDIKWIDNSHIEFDKKTIDITSSK